MSLPSYETKARPSPWWYSLVALLWIASAVVFAVVVIKPFVDVLSTDVTGFANGDPVSVGSDGLSVYAESTETLGACTLTGSDGVAIRMDDLDSTGTEFKVDTNGPTLTAYASTPDGLAAGTYEIACEGGESTILATGERIDEGDLEQSLAIGFISSLALGVLGLALLIVLLVKRHNSKSRIRAAQSAAYYGGWAQQGYSAPEGTYPPPPYDPYAQQQQGYGSPQGYTAPPQQDYYGQQTPPPADPYGQQVPPPADPYAQQTPPPTEPHGQQDTPPPPPAYPPTQGYPPAEGQQPRQPGTQPPTEASPETPPRDSRDTDKSTDSTDGTDSDNR
jgi:hypothetical protein